MIEFSRTIPILRSFDETKAKEFYLGYLGFTIDWTHRFEPRLPLYMQISRGALLLHLSEHHGDGTPGSCTFVEMTGIKAFHAELAARNYGNMRPAIEDAPWHAWTLTVIDPFANTIRFSERKPE